MQQDPAIDYKAQFQEAQGTITVLKHRIEQLEKMIFGAKHERFVACTPPPGQLVLDLQAEQRAEVNSTATQKIEYTRTKTTQKNNYTEHPGRNSLPGHLRREEIVLEPEDVPEGSIRIGELISVQLEATPSELYARDGNLSIDNNAVENSIRPVALGRKNFLFCGSGEAARRAAMIYSLLGSCKLGGINPLVWLTDVLTRLPMHPINQIREFLPHSWKPLQD